MDAPVNGRPVETSPATLGRFTKVSVETKAGELEARLSEFGNWEVRVRHHD